MYSNVYFDPFKSDIHCWEYEDGKKVHKVLPAPLYFYIEDNEPDENGYKTIYGGNARYLTYERWGKYKAAREKYKDWGKKLYESDVPIETKFIVSNYLGIDLKVPDFDIHYLDIEVHSERGFPRPEDAAHPITIITVWSTKHEKFFCFSEKDFDESFITKNGESCEKIICDTERKLLTKYIDWTRDEHPDIITGWNSNGFDMPYIMNRTKVLFGEEATKDISPIGKTRSREVFINGRTQERWSIAGISLLDMLEIYQNYTQNQHESWKLDHIAKVELGDKKIEYDGSLADLYKNDWQKYVEYNVHDVRLLRKLEDKKKFIPLLITFCYGCHVPLDYYDRVTKVLDGAFISELIKDKIVLPDVKRDIEQDSQYIGGFVKDPLAGLHEWIVSFDATSLYPSIMMGWNISPETKVGSVPQIDVKNVMKCMASGQGRETPCLFCGEETNCGEAVDFIKDQNLCMAANGILYSQDVQGVVPRFVEEWFNKRKVYKKKMLAAQSRNNKVEADEYDALQQNYKLLINSVYGFLGTPYSRLFDLDNAVAITMSARYVTITTGSSIKKHFTTDDWKNSAYGKTNLVKKASEDPVIYCDTDSVYVDFGRIMKTLNYDFKSKHEEVTKNFIIYNENKTNDEFNVPHDLDMDSLSDDEKEKIIQRQLELSGFENTRSTLQNHVNDIIDQAMEKLTINCFNCKTNKIFFKREAVASRGIFVARKKYVLWALNNEGVELPEAKRLKVTGIDIVRSNVPRFVRANMKKLIIFIFKHLDQEKSINLLREIHDDFWEAPPSDIAFFKSANNITKYTKRYEKSGAFKGTSAPQHVKGAILYNNIVSNDDDLVNEYDVIYDGDKLSYLYFTVGPKWTENIFAFKDRWLKNQGWEEYIDRRKQFEVSMLSPVRKFFDLLEWHIPDFENADMSDMFEWE